MVMMHGFAAGNDDQIARRSRDGMGQVFATVRSTGCTDERAQEFIAQGMLLNVMLSMRAPEHLDENPDLDSAGGLRVRRRPALRHPVTPAVPALVLASASPARLATLRAAGVEPGR